MSEQPQAEGVHEDNHDLPLTETDAQVTEPGATSPQGAVADADVAKLQEQVVAAQNQVLRVQADMQNLRRRAEADVEKAHKFALEKFVRELLPVIDGLEKTLEGAGEDVPPVFLQGVEMTLSMLLGGVGKFGVEAVSPQGQSFDPQMHEAMSMIDAPGAVANSVVAVVQKGYLLNSRLVRPAMVVVARGAAPAIDEQA